MNEPNVTRGFGPGMVPIGYVWTGDHWEAPQQPVVIEGPGPAPYHAMTVVGGPRGGYTSANMLSPEIYIEGLGWRPREQGSLGYPDTPLGKMYSALSGFNWIDRTPKPYRPLTQNDANAWLQKVGAIATTTPNTLAQSYNSFPSYNISQGKSFQPERDYNPFPNYYGNRTQRR